MDIESYLKDAGVRYEMHKHGVAYTAQQMAAAEHVTGDAVAKPVVVHAGKKYVLCVVPASCKVDLSRLAQTIHAKRCRLAEETELGSLFPDVEIGAEPPFGKPYGLETLVDARLTSCERIAFTAGDHRQTVLMRYDDYARLAEPTVADFSVHL
jgi:Ala-tRNA(Pro) deacylase